MSRLRLIIPGDADAAVTISARDNSGAEATGGDVPLTPAAGGATTLTAQQLEAGDSTITGQFTLIAGEGEQFTETGESAGVTTTDKGSYSYQAIGPDAGRLTLTYDDGDECRANFYFASPTNEFSVNVRGRGSFLGRLAGIRIRINNETINGRVYDFKASHQGDGVWRIDRVAGNM